MSEYFYSMGDKIQAVKNNTAYEFSDLDHFIEQRF